jgi:hypothetical protein
MNWTSSVWWRGGLLPRTLNGDYIFGRDAKYGTLIDLGGHREAMDSDIRATAVREAKEESLGLVDVHPEDLGAVWVYAGTALFPVDIDISTQALLAHFNQRVQQEINPEVTQLVPVPEEDLMTVIANDDPPLYHRTRNVILRGNYLQF